MTFSSSRARRNCRTGGADQALTLSNQAIQADPNRWEAYALAGGALMNLKRYDEAIDDLTKAIEHAPEAKQQGLRDLRKQCVLAESGTSPTPPPPAQSAATTQAEIVLWKTIENSTNPDDFDAYLKQYANGAFAVLASQRSQSLHAAALAFQAKKREDAAQAAQDQKDHLPAICHDKICGMSYGYLLIRPDGFSYSGDKTFEFKKSEVNKVHVKCNQVFCEVDTLLANGETHGFISVSEESIITRKDRTKYLTPAVLIFDRFKEQWGWTVNGSGKGKNNDALTPPIAAQLSTTTPIAGPGSAR
jgi:hypothetical protein